MGLLPCVLFLTGLAGSEPLRAAQFESRARLAKSQFSSSARPKEWPVLTAHSPELGCWQHSIHMPFFYFLHRLVHSLQNFLFNKHSLKAMHLFTIQYFQVGYLFPSLDHNIL